MIHNSNNTVIDRIVRTGLATPALALTILAGAAFAQQGGGSGRAYEVVVEAEGQEGGAHAGTIARVAPKQDGPNIQTVVEVNRVVDGKTISLRQVNDEPIVVKIDGKVLSKDRYEIKKGVVIITEPGTGQKHEFAMPERPSAPVAGGPVMGRIEIAEPVMPQRLRLNTMNNWAQAQAAEAPQPQPKVMLGVVMAEPDTMILEHLGLDTKKAVMLERVVDGLPADKAGLKAKDIIVGFGEKAEPRSADEIRKILSKAQPGSTVMVKVIRKGEPVTVELKFEAFDGQALGRAMAPTGVGGAVQFAPQGGERWAVIERDREAQHSHMERAEKAMKEAAEMLARMEGEVGRNARDAHRQASDAIRQAIEAMREGEAFGLEIEDMRRMQQQAVERLREDMGNQNNRRFWAQPGERGEGFALTFPDRDDDREDRWADRLEQLEERLDQLESGLDRAIERLESRTEAMMERLMDRLERALDERGGGR